MSEDVFLMLTEPYLARHGVTRGTMMGYACVRVHGNYFASITRDGATLIVKQPADRVAALVASGAGEPFAPAGRVFKEWLAVPKAREDSWAQRIGDAFDFVQGLPRKR